MRKIALVACIGLSAFAAGCTAGDDLYLREGIGTHLAPSDLPQISYLQDVYVGEICRQAGLRVERQGEILVCEEVNLRSADWATFVQAGMNDIDRRCDAYLAWLDNKRRSREPILAQLSTTAAATAAILGVTGAGPHALSIVGTAFGFAADSFLNYQSRLITEVDQTVVQSVVLGHQNEFRLKLANTPINNRPAALYLLRNYLRICTPFSIEMSISNTVTTFHRGGSEALRRDPEQIRAPTVAKVTAPPPPRETVIIRSKDPPPPAPPVRQAMLGSISDLEKRSISLEDAKDFQRTLCVADGGDFGSTGSNTRVELRKFYSAFTARDAAPDTIRTDADLRRLRNAQRMFPSCQDAGFRNGFEVGIYSRHGTEQMRAWLRQALQVATLPIPQGLAGPPVGSTIDKPARDAIAALRTKFNLPGAAELDWTFHDTLLNNLAR